MRITRHASMIGMLAGLAIATTASAAAAAASSAQGESRATAIATGIAHLTGLAISPLIVLVTIGWIDYAGLVGSGATQPPLHASPWLLIPCSTVLALVLAKKLATPAIPLPIRKLLDAAEYLEAKLSALVAAGVLVPTIAATIAAATDGSGSAAQTAGITASWAGIAVLVPVALILFGAVWLTFHVVDALIVLSPFAVLDMALAGARLAVLALVGGALLVSPFLAVVLCAPIIVLSLLFAGWCVRLDLFALTVATDLLLRRSRSADPAAPLRGFLASRGLGAPIRTMGHLEPTARGLAFRYRPLFLLPRRTIALAPDAPVLVRGAVWATLRDDSTRRSLVALAPRYSAHHATVGERLGATSRDGLLRGSWRTIREGIATILAGQAEPQKPAPGAGHAATSASAQ